jgi:hypothetical protein
MSIYLNPQIMKTIVRITVALCLFPLGEAKTLFLCWGDIPFRNTIRKNKARLEREMILDKAGIWTRDANGHISQAALNPEKDGLSVNIPAVLELNGLYLVGVHLHIGEMNINSDGVIERIHLLCQAPYLSLQDRRSSAK